MNCLLFIGCRADEMSHFWFNSFLMELVLYHCCCYDVCNIKHKVYPFLFEICIMSFILPYTFVHLHWSHVVNNL